MKRTLKVVAILLGITIALLVILAVALTLLIDPNRYKDEIAHAVQENTGRQLKISGKLGLSVFPWIGLETGAMELSNAPGFGDRPFASIQSAGIKVKVLPLLRKKLVVDRVALDGLTLNLARNREGRNNWDDLMAAGKKEKPEAPSKPAERMVAPAFAVGGIDIRRANVTWQDQTTGTHYAVQDLDLKTGKLAGAEPVDVRLGFDLESGQPPLRTRVDLTGRIGLDVDRQTLSVPRLSLAVAGMTVNAAVKGEKIFDAPVLAGRADVPPFDLRGLTQKLGVKLETADQRALSKFGLKSAFVASSNLLRLQGLDITLDDSRLTGGVEVRNFARPAYRFDLTLDRIDADRYFPPSAPAPAKSAAAAVPAPIEIPLQTLRSLDLAGMLHIKQMKAMDLRSSDIIIRLKAQNGLISIGPNKAKLYGGSYGGRTSLDARTSDPVLNINESLSGVQLAPLVRDAYKKDLVAGTANLNAKLTAHGLDAARIKTTLNGTAGFFVSDGTVKGIDLGKMVDQIQSAIKEKRVDALAALVPKVGDETKFTRLQGTARIRNGVVYNDDLAIEAPHLRVAGKGTVNLPEETVDYTITAGNYPILVNGPFTKLSYRPDWKTITKAKVEKAVEKKKEKVEQRLKQRLEKKLEKLLR